MDENENENENVVAIAWCGNGVRGEDLGEV